MTNDQSGTVRAGDNGDEIDAELQEPALLFDLCDRPGERSPGR